jgi:hypothetical protein
MRYFQGVKLDLIRRQRMWRLWIPYDLRLINAWPRHVSWGVKNSHVVVLLIEAGALRLNYFERRIFLICFTAFLMLFTCLLLSGFLLAAIVFIGFSFL